MTFFCSVRFGGFFCLESLVFTFQNFLFRKEFLPRVLFSYWTYFICTLVHAT